MKKTFTLILISVCSCMLNASSKERMRDAVIELNDHARWGRTPAAVSRVSPSYQRQFMSQHAAWGTDIQIADIEVQHMALDEDNDDHATAIVQWSWYKLKHMELHQTIVKQQWEKGGSGFELASERVLSGDATLLAANRP